MTYTDAQGRPELVADPDIARGTATYRVIPGDGPVPDKKQTRPRRALSPIRSAAARTINAGLGESARP